MMRRPIAPTYYLCAVKRVSTPVGGLISRIG